MPNVCGEGKGDVLDVRVVFVSEECLCLFVGVWLHADWLVLAIAGCDGDRGMAFHPAIRDPFIWGIVQKVVPAVDDLPVEDPKLRERKANEVFHAGAPTSDEWGKDRRDSQSI